MSNAGHDVLVPGKPDRPIHHIFMPSAPAPHSPAKGHVNHIPQATVPEQERTYQVDIDGDGVIPAP